MTWVPIRYTQILFRGISSASLDGNLPYFIFDRFARWQVSQLLTYFWKVFSCQASTNVEESLRPFYPLLDEGDTYGTNVILVLVKLTE